MTSYFFEKEKKRKNSHLELTQSSVLMQSSFWMAIIWTPFFLMEVSPWPQRLVCCRWLILDSPACCCCSQQTFEGLAGCTQGNLHSCNLLRRALPPSTRSSSWCRCCIPPSPSHEQTLRRSSLPTETPLKKAPCPLSLLCPPSPRCSQQWSRCR